MEYQNWWDRIESCPDGGLLLNSAAQIPQCSCPSSNPFCGTDPHRQKQLGPQCPNTPTAARTVFGNPCDAATGNKYEAQTDFAGAGLAVTRSYNSGFDGDVGFGVGWTSALFARLEIAGTTVLVRAGTGRGEPWTPDSAGVWHGDADSVLALAQDATGFTLTFPDGTVERYDTAGHLLTRTDAHGLVTAFGYDGLGHLVQVLGPFGHTLALTYDGAQVATVTDPAGAVWRYAYDAQSNLVGVTDPTGATRRYVYDDPRLPHALTGIVDENGARFATFTYDATGKAASTEHAGGVGRFGFVYDSATQTTVTDAAGTQQVLTFGETLGVKNLLAERNLADGLTHTQVFDTQNNLTCVADELGHVTTYTYTATNERASTTEGQGGDCTNPLALPETRTTTYQYLSAALALPTVITRASVAPGKAAVTTVSYQGTLPVSITQSGFTPDGSPVRRTVTLTYTPQGQVATLDGPRTDVNDVTTFSYDDCAAGSACGQLKAVTDALGHTTTFDAYDGAGRLTQETDPNGRVTAYAYDARGRLITVTEGAPGATARVTRYAYDAAGELSQTTSPEGRTLAYTYDAAHQLIGVTDGLGNRVTYAYDSRGHRTHDATLDLSGTLAREVTRVFDARNHVSRVNGGGHVTALTHDALGNLVGTTDPNGHPATNGYDALNRLLTHLDRLGGTTHYAYDVHDRPTAVSAPHGATTAYAYDDLGELLTEQSPDRGTLTYTYDAAGNVASLTDARGVTARLTYDALSRVTAVDYPGTQDDLAYTYDTCSAGIGRLCAVTGRFPVTYAYDPFGDVVATTRTLAGRRYTTRYAYDGDGRLIELTYPTGETVTYTRDAVGRVERVVLTRAGVATDVVSAMSYRPDGRLASLTFGNGLVETRAYDLAGRLLTQTLGGLTRAYTYDANGNVLTRPGASTAYDALDRVVNDQLGVQWVFTYDPNGNRTQETIDQVPVGLAYAPRSNRLTGITLTAGRRSRTLAIDYDAAGNPVALPALHATLTYDGAGRLEGVGRAVRYGYDERNLRITKTRGRHTTLYHDDEAGTLLEETTARGRLIRLYVNLPTDHGSVPLAQLTRPDALVYLHTDALGTPRLATDATKTVVWSFDADAFGSLPPNEDPDGDGNTTVVNLRFPGQYYDRETGFFYNWNRYYDPRIGRYITSDPIGLAGGVNTYEYVGSNPLRFADTLGLTKWTGTIKSGMFLTAGAAIIKLKSECINGKQASITVVGVGPGLGVGAKLPRIPKEVPSGSTDNIEFQDGRYNVIDPNSFNGKFLMASASAVVGRGPSLGGVICGKAVADVSLSWPKGLDVSYGFVYGSCTVVKTKVKDCDCHK